MITETKTASKGRRRDVSRGADMVSAVQAQRVTYHPESIAEIWRKAKTTAVSSGAPAIVALTGPDWTGQLFVIHELDLDDIIAARNARATG